MIFAKRSVITTILTRRRTICVHGVLVKVGGVQVALDLGHDGHGQAAQAQTLPVKAVKPPKTRKDMKINFEMSGGKVFFCVSLT